MRKTYKVTGSPIKFKYRDPETDRYRQATGIEKYREFRNQLEYKLMFGIR